jgi:hypothetical protein
MTKYLLILQVCSFLTGECKPAIQYGPYNNWHECSMAGMLNGMTQLQKESSQDINTYRLAVKFGCTPVNEV